MRESGVYQTLNNLRHFIPNHLPPANPEFSLNAEIMTLYGEASFALGQLNEMSLRLPDPKRFIRAYVMKEALLSSAIEGIHTTLIEAFTKPISGDLKLNKDTQLVVNYTKAVDAALKMIKDEGMPLVSRVILKAHEALMLGGVGEKANPGSYRKQSVRVGNLVPPPAPEVPNLISDLEKYMNEPSELPPLIRAGLVHVQFETIHPFLDGNGRIGRLLIVLMLIDSGLLALPVLYPSYYFKKHHLEYYQRLDQVRSNGDFEGWTSYYLKAIRDSAIDSHKRAKEIEALDDRLKKLIHDNPQLKKMAKIADLALGQLFTQPIISVAEMSQFLDRPYNTTSKLLKLFHENGVVSENIIHKRNRVYRFDLYLELLEKEYE